MLRKRLPGVISSILRGVAGRTGPLSRRALPAAPPRMGQAAALAERDVQALQRRVQRQRD